MQHGNVLQWPQVVRKAALKPVSDGDRHSAMTGGSPSFRAAPWFPRDEHEAAWRKKALLEQSRRILRDGFLRAEGSVARLLLAQLEQAEEELKTLSQRKE